MRNLLHRILKTLNINGRDWVVLLLALLLAFSIWLIHNLSLRYSDMMSISVVARCNITGHSDVSVDKAEVSARCRATGYKVIKSYLRRGKVVELTFRQTDLKHKEGDIFYVTTSDLKDYSHLLFGPEVAVEHFVSDTLFFRFPFENSKVVPVRPISTVTFRSQYMAVGEMGVYPDSIRIYGEEHRLENLDAVYTKPINYIELSHSVTGSVKLERIKGVRMSESSVQYSLTVKRFVEVIVSVPISVVNVPAGKEMLVYPSTVDVISRCSFPLVDDPENGLRVEADYNDYVNSISGRCPLKVSAVSRGVLSSEVVPATVSCVLEDKR